jgi:cytochrome P450 monooxygenase
LRLYALNASRFHRIKDVEFIPQKLLATVFIINKPAHTMIIVDNLWSLAVASGLLAIFLNILWGRFKEYQGRKAHGCGVIPSYPQWDRIFGLDLALSQMKALRGDTFIPWLAAMHEGQPSTFKIRFLGKRQIYTTETDNLKAMTAINWKDFGISPLRRSTKAFHPFADKGVNTVDGDNWVFSRFLIKPFFNRDVYTNTDRIRPYVDSLLSLLPPDGETFNIQPLLQRWVSRACKKKQFERFITMLIRT